MVADFNSDCNCDFAVSVPALETSEVTDIYVVYGDGLGGSSDMHEINISGWAYDMVAADVNRDNMLDLVAANGIEQRLEIFYGDDVEYFTGPDYIVLEGVSGTELTYILATLDLNRDGNYDFASGGPDGTDLALAIDQQSPSTESLDEMVVTGYDYISVKVVNPDGFIISEDIQTVAGSDFWRNDVDDNGLLDEETYDYNLQYGEYTLILTPQPDAPPDQCFDAGVRINGSVKAIIFDEYQNSNVIRTKSRIPGCPEDTIVFYYTVEAASSIQPGNGMKASLTPTFDWAGLVGKIFPEGSYHFQLDRYHDFRSPIIDEAGLIESHYQVSEPLGIDSVFYWRFRSFAAGGWTEFSRTFAVYIVDYVCGDSNGDGVVNVSDAVHIINYVFVGGNAPNPVQAGDCNCDGTCNVSDAVGIINYVFVGGNLPCDMDGDGIPDC